MCYFILWWAGPSVTLSCRAINFGDVLLGSRQNSTIVIKVCVLNDVSGKGWCGTLKRVVRYFEEGGVVL